MKESEIVKINKDSKLLIELGHSISNAGYFMKRALKEQILSESIIQKYNEDLFKGNNKVVEIKEESVDSNLLELQKECTELMMRAQSVKTDEALDMLNLIKLR